VLAAVLLGAPSAALAQVQLEPAFSIWDVTLGDPVSQIPESTTAIIACGTDGGPPSTALDEFEGFAVCPAEANGLHEVYFTYDDEQDYIAKALGSEYQFVQGGTSVFAHPVIVSVLVDDGGIVRGIRIVTDDRVSDTVRRGAAALTRNFKTRFVNWTLACDDLPPVDGEKPVGRMFIHELCKGTQGDETVHLETYYLRKRGQEGLNRETGQVNKGYFSSGVRMTILQSGYEP
jgi:hypothetical protein